VLDAVGHVVRLAVVQEVARRHGHGGGERILGQVHAETGQLCLGQGPSLGGIHGSGLRVVVGLRHRTEMQDSSLADPSHGAMWSCPDTAVIYMRRHWGTRTSRLGYVSLRVEMVRVRRTSSVGFRRDKVTSCERASPSHGLQGWRLPTAMWQAHRTRQGSQWTGQGGLS